MTGAHVTDHVGRSIDHCPRGEQHHTPPRTCPACGREPPAGYVRCPRVACRTVYAKWPTDTTRTGLESHECAVQYEGDPRPECQLESEGLTPPSTEQ